MRLERPPFIAAVPVGLPPAPPPLPRLERPRLLIAAARAGLKDYRRARDLRRILGGEAGHGTLDALIAREAELEGQRQARDAAWSAARHVEVLIALLAEAAFR